MNNTPPVTSDDPPLYLSAMLRDGVVDAKGKPIGALADVIVRLDPEQYPALSGLVMKVGPNNLFVPMSDVLEIGRAHV